MRERKKTRDEDFYFGRCHFREFGLKLTADFGKSEVAKRRKKYSFEFFSTRTGAFSTWERVRLSLLSSQSAFQGLRSAFTAPKPDGRNLASAHFPGLATEFSQPMQIRDFRDSAAISFRLLPGRISFSHQSCKKTSSEREREPSRERADEATAQQRKNYCHAFCARPISNMGNTGPFSSEWTQRDGFTLPGSPPFRRSGSPKRPEKMRRILRSVRSVLSECEELP